jgi:hypothetical protein
MKPAHNSTLAIGGVQSPLDSFEVAESSVLRINIFTKNPAQTQSRKPLKPFILLDLTIGLLS